MGCIIDSCEYSDNLFLENPICYSAKVIFVINILFIIFIIRQIYLYHMKKGQYFTRKLILFYLMFLEIIVNMLYSGVRSWIQLYLIDIVQRHFVFIYLIYYFGRKLMNLMDPLTPLQKKSPLILSLCSSLYFFALLFYGLIDSDKSDPGNSCKDSFWVYLRVGGLITIFFFVIVGVILINRHKKAYESNAEFTMIIKYSIDANNNNNIIGDMYNESEKIFIENNIETLLIKDEKNYDIWLIMGTHFFSAVLSLTTTIYYAVTLDSSSKDCGFYPFDKEMTDNLAGIILLGWALYLINYFIPLVVIIRVFLFKEMKVSIRQPSISSVEEYPFHGNLKVHGQNQGLNIEKYISPKSSSSSIQENSSNKSLEEHKIEEKEEEEEEEDEEEEETKDMKELKKEIKSSGFL